MGSADPRRVSVMSLELWSGEEPMSLPAWHRMTASHHSWLRSGEGEACASRRSGHENSSR